MKKLALIIGIGSGYPDPYKIKCTPYDVTDLSNTLIAKGFSVTKLLDKYATRYNILANITSIISKAYSGDSISISFLGHGTHIYGNEPDGFTECICPVDINVKTGANVITDYTLSTLLTKLRPGVSCDFVNGVCFSGTSTRSLACISADNNIISNPWEIPGIVITPDTNPIPTPEPEYSEIDPGDISLSTVVAAKMNHVLWAASKSTEYSHGAYFNGIPRNIYIYYWCQAIRNYGLTRTRSQIDSLVSASVLKIVSQHCQLEGPYTELVQKPFT